MMVVNIVDDDRSDHYCWLWTTAVPEKVQNADDDEKSD
jgi:hypothetical protein